MAKRRKNNTGVPDAELDSIARVLYSSIKEFNSSLTEIEAWFEKNK